MITSSMLRQLEEDLYNILDYELPPYHQISEVSAKYVGGGVVNLLFIINHSGYGEPDRGECERTIKQYNYNVCTQNPYRGEIAVTNSTVKFYKK